MKLQFVKSQIFRVLRFFIWGFGVTALVMFILSFTDIPYHAYYNLGTAFPLENESPNVIVIMGGSGMPSPDGLIRTYYAAEVAKEFKNATIIIALPENERDGTHQLDLMAHELQTKGIDSARIKYESSGFNTRSQAVEIAGMYPDNKQEIKVLIVTSPEHVYRSVRCFVKSGFREVYGLPTFEKPSDASSLKDKNEEQISPGLGMRYNMWSYLNYELLVMREYLAISYYKINGWI